MACETADTYTDDSVTHCLSHSSMLPADSEEITCSGVLTGVAGRLLDLSVEVAAEDMDGTLRAGSVTAAMGVLVFHLNISPEAFGGQYPLGEYSCVLSSGGEELARQTFNVGVTR